MGAEAPPPSAAERSPYWARFRVNAMRRKNVDEAVARSGEAGGMKKARRRGRGDVALLSCGEKDAEGQYRVGRCERSRFCLCWKRSAGALRHSSHTPVCAGTALGLDWLHRDSHA